MNRHHAALIAALVLVVVPPMAGSVALASPTTATTVSPPEKPMVALKKQIQALKALGHNTLWAWTEAKAAKVVARDARVLLPAADRKSLEIELRESIRTFALSQLAARDGVAQLPDPEHYAPARCRRAREKVREGLMILSAICRGSGAAISGSRFKQFRCSVTSEAIEIPKRTMVPPTVEGELPTVVEGPTRIIGPLEARLDVHVTGKSSMAHRQVG